MSARGVQGGGPRRAGLPEPECEHGPETVASTAETTAGPPPSAPSAPPASTRAGSAPFSFPTHWEAPPVVASGGMERALSALRNALTAGDSARWLEALARGPEPVRASAARLRDETVQKPGKDVTQLAMGVLAQSLRPETSPHPPEPFARLFAGLVEQTARDGLLPTPRDGRIVDSRAAAVVFGRPEPTGIETRSAFLSSRLTWEGSSNPPTAVGLSFTRIDGERSIQVRLTDRTRFAGRAHEAIREPESLIQRELPRETEWFLCLDQLPEDRGWLQAFAPDDAAKMSQALEAARPSTLIRERRLYFGFDGDGRFLGAAQAERHPGVGDYLSGRWQIVAP